MYKVLAFFIDGEDNRHQYNRGDEYPRKGYTPTAERVRGLLGKDNKRGTPLIVKVEEVETAEKRPEEVETAEKVVEVPETPKVKKPRGKRAKK